MSSGNQEYTGIWLHDTDQRGKDFSHSAAEYDHPGADAGSTRMRHVYVDQAGGRVGVWVPEHWSEEQAAQALQSNW